MAQTEYENNREREASRKAKKVRRLVAADDGGGVWPSGRLQEDSFLNKINTLTRRKKSVTRDERDSRGATPANVGAAEARDRRAATEPTEDEVERLEREGHHVLESCLVLPEPDLNLLEDGEWRQRTPTARKSATSQVNKFACSPPNRATIRVCAPSFMSSFIGQVGRAKCDANGRFGLRASNCIL